MFDGIDGNGGPAPARGAAAGGAAAGGAAAGGAAAGGAMAGGAASQGVLWHGAGTDAAPLRLHGTLDAEGARQLRGTFATLAETGCGTVIVDLAGIGFLDGAGVGAVASLFRQLAVRGRRLVICGAVGQPLLLLHDLGMAKMLGIAERRRPNRAVSHRGFGLGVRA